MGSTLAVVAAVATVEEVSPMGLDPLYESVDGEALDRILDSSVTPVQVSFPFEGYEVTVSSDGQITLAPREE